MKRVAWIGWLLAGLLFVQNVAIGLAAPAATNPLEGHLLRNTSGAFYVYHDGLKFAVQMADVGDQLIAVIPTASSTQWDALFTTPPGINAPMPPGMPDPVPGYS